MDKELLTLKEFIRDLVCLLDSTLPQEEVDKMYDELVQSCRHDFTNVRRTRNEWLALYCRLTKPKSN